MTYDEMIQQVEDHFNNISDEDFIRKLEECKNDPFTKLLEQAFGCDECLKENGECKHCIIGGKNNA